MSVEKNFIICYVIVYLPTIFVVLSFLLKAL